jgi:hypothetical protein
MYVGHFAIGVAIKSILPKTPTLSIMLGVGFMDIVDGLLIIAGIDRVTPNLNSGPYLFFDLTFIDWDHSLLMAIVLSLLWAGLFWNDKRTAGIAALAVFSHFLADWPLHNHDLALYPYSEAHLGYGLWGKLGTASWLLEGAFIFALIAFAEWRNRAREVTYKWAVLVVALLFIQMSPWLSPMKFVAQLSEPTARLLHGALVSIGFLLPGLLLTWLINHAERQPALASFARGDATQNSAYRLDDRPAPQ